MAKLNYTGGFKRPRRIKCSVCGKLTAGRKPRAVWNLKPSGDFFYPRKHKYDGKICDGSFHEGEWID